MVGPGPMMLRSPRNTTGQPMRLRTHTDDSGQPTYVQVHIDDSHHDALYMRPSNTRYDYLRPSQQHRERRETEL